MFSKIVFTITAVAGAVSAKIATPQECASPWVPYCSKTLNSSPIAYLESNSRTDEENTQTDDIGACADDFIFGWVCCASDPDSDEDTDPYTFGCLPANVVAHNKKPGSFAYPYGDMSTWGMTNEDALALVRGDVD